VPDAVAALRALPAGSFLSGIRHPVLIEPDPDWLARPAVLGGLRALAAAGLAFDVVPLPHQLPATVTAARLVPELAFVLHHPGRIPSRHGPGSHGGPVGLSDPRPGRAAERDLQAVWRATSPARASDLRPYYETVLAAFGPDRLMFGSGWPVSTLAAPYSEVHVL
jgi:L-fuconolactonase